MNNTNCTCETYQLTQTEFDADLYTPEMPNDYSQASCEVICVTSKIGVYFDYNDKMWKDNYGNPVTVKRWRYPGAIRRQITKADKIRNVLSGFDMQTLSFEETVNELKKII